MERQAHFNPEVSRAVYMKDRKTERCIEHLPSTHLVSEDEIASRTSEFQDVHRIQKRQLHEYHAKKMPPSHASRYHRCFLVCL